MKKIFSKYNNTLFDVAVGPMIAVGLVVPLLMTAAIIIIIAVVIKLIVKARNKNK